MFHESHCPFKTVFFNCAGLARIDYQGIKGLCHTRKDITVGAIVQTVIGAGLIAWVLLLVMMMPM